MTTHKTLITGLALLLIFALAGCSGGGGQKKTDFAGEWRTGWGCEITITDVTEQSFRFSFTGVTQSGNIGNLEGKALFTADNKAVFAFENKELEMTATFEFSIADCKLIVALTEGDMEGYFGRGVYMQGEYAKYESASTSNDIHTEEYKQELPNEIGIKVTREGDEEFFTATLHKRTNIGYAIYLFPDFGIREHPNGYDVVEVIEAPNILMRIYSVNSNSQIPESKDDKRNRTATDYLRLTVEDKLLEVEFVFPWEAGDGWLQFLRSMAKTITPLSATDVNCDYIIPTESASKKDTAPPIENTENYANAHILLPDNWDGTSILANGFVWIDSRDTTLQKKYGIYPDGDNFYDDYEIWNENDQYYTYPLSPNVELYAGVITDDQNVDSAKKMTVSQFENYLRKRGYTEGKKDYGMISYVTFSNGTITKIEEKFTP